MTRLAISLETALDPVPAAAALAREVEAALGGPGEVAGAFVFATAAGGRAGEAVGRLLAARWPGAELAGTSFEGLVFDGRVLQGEPAVAVLAWVAGEGAPVPIACDAGVRDPERLVKEILSAAGRASTDPDDLVLLFPDALGMAVLPALLERLSLAAGGPWLAGGAAVGVDEGPAHAWSLPAESAESEGGGLLVGLWLPGHGAGGGWGEAVARGADQSVRSAVEARATERAPGRVQCAGGSRVASPWLEITACRSHWIDGLEGEPPVEWIRRQLGLADGVPIEPFLDRLMVRLAAREGAGREPDPDGRDADPDATPPDVFEERYLTGIDSRRGSIGVLGRFARRDRLAFALPDAAWAREALRSAVDALPDSPLVLQIGCRARDESLHGDRDLESAIVAHRSAGRRTLGVVAPFQLATDSTGVGRHLVHSTVLAAVGPARRL